MIVLEELVPQINDLLWSYILIFTLISLGLWFTIRTRLIQFRMVGEMIRLLGGKADTQVDGKGVSSFQAFCISLASRVGTGNLAGVALAISLGGPGAVFWMWLIALLGAASGFVESTLAQIYKVRDGETYRGGPAYYMEKALGKRWMGILFSILITLCFGLVFNAVQANTITLAFEPLGMDRSILGVVLVVAMALIIFGGVKRIARTAQLIVPVMAVLYILLALYVLAKNITQIPDVLGLIFSSAFGLKAVAGGGLGAAVMEGIKRGLFSNEAGMGSAPNAAATAEVSHPVKQGLIQTLGVFTDTLLICSCTAFMILFSGQYTTGEADGIQLTQSALGAEIGAWAGIFVAVAVFLFAFSSLVGNYYYGETNIEFIQADNKGWLTAYRLAVLGMVMFGSVAKIQIVWDLADLFMGSMALLNLIAIALLGPIAFAALKDYLRQKKEGKDPVFHISHIPGLKNVECWGAEESGQKTKQA
ncbi:AGCS family alanine or glycine:cation symporter [Melghirimyces profundicolus]|uniref:AGCS family alanine or glycine:cation symporter n=1 Tax=Melghirimyces profundicolus TaxID=1242148 RepID=A0A2T6C4Q4_9BACL|nr:alanine/glycine:cation symporter family protein [Melghirimyces profundicolus]PTX63285.1 AGCS family alanine or glycine:cation symporter [Melghirimyces profundicolus]